MVKIKQIYKKLLKEYGPQGWWPIINPKTLLCEYGTGAPNNDSERFEIACGCILTQNTQWYPNTVRALQQLKLGRPFTEKELEVIKEAEDLYKKISGNEKIQTKSHIFTQNTSWPNVEKALLNLDKIDAIDPKRIMKLDDKTITEAIRPAGYFNQKAKKLRIFSEYYLNLRGRTPARDDLLDVWGIGPETADSILLYAYKEPQFVVDTYTRRILKSIGIIDDKSSYDDIKTLFEREIEKKYEIYQEFHALLVEHAKHMRS